MSFDFQNSGKHFQKYFQKYGCAPTRLLEYYCTPGGDRGSQEHRVSNLRHFQNNFENVFEILKIKTHFLIIFVANVALGVGVSEYAKNVTEPNGTQPSYLEPQTGRTLLSEVPMAAHLRAATHLQNAGGFKV